MINDSFVARAEELRTLSKIWSSPDPELVAVYGRRRVGKTQLIRQSGNLQNGVFIEFTGQNKTSMKIQLVNFKNELSQTLGLSIETPKNWSEAFATLERIILTRSTEKKSFILFFDEAPWLDGKKSGFLDALEYFWNHSASRNPNVKVVICGSSASWVIQKVIYGKGGWHRRVTQKIHVKPFTLAETKLYLHSRNIRYSNRDIIRLYAVFGGIPFYLKMIQPGEAFETVVDRLLLEKDAIFRDEFDELFKSLFSHAKDHQKIITAIGSRRSGLTRKEISQLTHIPSGGGLTSYIKNLQNSDFITSYLPMGYTSEKEIHYRLTDLFTLFYLKWMKQKDAKTWQNILISPSYKSWMGYSFEIITWNHDEEIAKFLGLKRIPWTSTQAHLTEDGEEAKIDLLLDVTGGSLYLIEMKFYEQPYTITKSDAESIDRRRRVLAKHFKGNRSVITCLLAPQGIKESYLIEKTIDKVLSEEVFF